MAQSMTLKVILEAYDKMNGPMNKAINNAQGKLTQFAQRSDHLANKAYHSGKEMTAAGLAVAAPLVAVTKMAMDFEDAMADVAKVANMDRASEEFKKMSVEVLNTSEHLATSGDNVAKLYSSLLAGGTARGELSQVARIAGEASVAFDMTQEAAGEAFMTMKNAMGKSVEETKKAFDATNAITNKFGGKASQILDFMSSGGASVARTLNASAPEMEAFGRTLMMSGVSASEAGTVMQRFRVGLYKNAEALAIFKKAGGGADGMKAVFDAAQKSGDSFKWFQAHKFGEYASQMSLVSMNGEKLGEMLEFVGNEQNYVNSANQEFANRTSTTSFKLNQAKIAFQNAAIKAGTVLLPVLTSLIKAVTPLIERLSKWVEKNPKLVEGIAKAAAVFSALALAGGYVSFALSGVFRLFNLAAVGGRGFMAVIRAIVNIKKIASWWSFLFQVRLLQVREASAKATFWMKKLGHAIRTDATNAFKSVSQFITGRAIPALKACGSFIAGGFSRAVMIGKMAWQALGVAFTANPIGFILKALAIVATIVFGLLIAKFGSVKGALNALGRYIKVAARVMFWPIFLVIELVRRKFDTIIAVIEKVKKLFRTIGKGIMNFLGMGVEEGKDEPVKKIAGVTKEMRAHLPSSPAKKGAFRDLHKIKIAETLAKTITLSPFGLIMGTLAKGAIGLFNKGLNKPGSVQMAKAGSGGGAITANFTINLSGGATEKDANRIAQAVRNELKNQQDRQRRLGYAHA